MAKRTRARAAFSSQSNAGWREDGDDGFDLPDPVHDLAPTAVEAVYFITTRDMQLLYVGQSRNLIQRLRTHAKKDWFTPECRVFVEWFRDRDEAQSRETNAIWNSRPPHNNRIGEPSGPSPEPVIPLRPLTDLDRDLALCWVCGIAVVHTAKRCAKCYDFRRQYGTDRRIEAEPPFTPALMQSPISANK